jgi:hypothetical protein
MEMLALRVGAALATIFIAGVVIALTKWLIACEEAYPRETCPTKQSDRFHGVLLGFVVAVAWGICDIVLNRLWHRPAWDAGAWEYRIAMFLLIVLASRLTFVEIFRVIRCKRNAPPGSD